MVRFTKTGSDATSAAVRLARAYTKRSDCGLWLSAGTTGTLVLRPERVSHPVSRTAQLRLSTIQFLA